MALTAEQKAGIKDATILQEIEETEREVARLNSENSDRRVRITQAEKDKKARETELTDLRDKMKKIGFDTDSDIEEQFPSLIDRITKDKGYKPSSEVDALTRKLDAINKKLEVAEATAAKEKLEGMIEKVAGVFEPVLNENFGKAAPLIKKLLRTTGRFAVKDGVEGIQNGEDFLPLVAEKGSLSAIDQLKKEYGDLVVAKQKPGTGGSGTNKTTGANDKVISRTEFDALAPLAKMDFFKHGGQLSENIE